MKPMRRVMSVAHVMAFRLACGHTVYRAPLSGKAVIPLRMGCGECEQEHFRRFDLEQAVARAARRVNQK
jgi:hypothetical protein